MNGRGRGEERWCPVLYKECAIMRVWSPNRLDCLQAVDDILTGIYNGTMAKHPKARQLVERRWVRAYDNALWCSKPSRCLPLPNGIVPTACTSFPNYRAGPPLSPAVLAGSLPLPSLTATLANLFVTSPPPLSAPSSHLCLCHFPFPSLLPSSIIASCSPQPYPAPSPPSRRSLSAARGTLTSAPPPKHSLDLQINLIPATLAREQQERQQREEEARQEAARRAREDMQAMNSARGTAEDSNVPEWVRALNEWVPSVIESSWSFTGQSRSLNVVHSAGLCYNAHTPTGSRLLSLLPLLPLSTAFTAHTASTTNKPGHACHCKHCVHKDLPSTCALPAPPSSLCHVAAPVSLPPPPPFPTTHVPLPLPTAPVRPPAQPARPPAPPAPAAAAPPTCPRPCPARCRAPRPTRPPACCAPSPPWTCRRTRWASTACGRWRRC